MTLQAWPHDELPESVRWQAVSFMRVAWPSIDGGMLRHTYPEALQPIHYAVTEGQLLLSYAATFTTQVSQEKTTFEAVCLGNVFTYPGARHRGYARQVVDAATLAIRSSGADVAALLCSPELTPFYATSGWVPTPESATVTVDAEVVDAVRMMLFLSPRGRGARSRLESLPLHVPFPW